MPLLISLSSPSFTNNNLIMRPTALSEMIVGASVRRLIGYSEGTIPPMSSSPAVTGFLSST
jgi:hypothetical protein